MNIGVYKIVNKVTGDFYIGSSVNLNKRFNNHKHFLANQRHHNIILQNVFNKYGLDNLSFEIIEIVENKTNLIKREQYYIDTLNPKYNICLKAESPLGTKRTKKSKHKMSKAAMGRKHSKETKQKISKNSSKYWKDKKLSKESIEKRTKSRSKPFKIKSPNGDTIKGINLAKFCRDNNLHYSSMHKVYKGVRNQHKGWTCP
jgi:group I intron endonuclease